jgi:hypothetical protein
MWPGGGREAQAACQEAGQGFAVIERPTIEERKAAKLPRNAVIYTSRQWQSHR